MKKLAVLAALAAFAFAAPAAAQWQTPNHSVPVGKGAGVTGFGAAVPGTVGRPLVSTGALTDPAFGSAANAGIAAGAANTLKGSLDGANTTDNAVPACTASGSALKWTAGVGFSCGTIAVTTGFDTPINLGLFASAAGSALTINVTTASGATPSPASPVLVAFRSLTATTGTVAYSTISAATSIIVPNGATLGATNSVPFRIWIFLDANGGTPAVGVATCSSPTAIFPCSAWEGTLKTTTTIDTAADSGGVLYATAGVTGDAVRIIGYCDFENGLAAAGAWVSSCTQLQVFGPGIKKPGDVVQTIRTSLGTVISGTGVFAHSNAIPQQSGGDLWFTQAVVPTAKANILVIESYAAAGNSTTNWGAMALFQDATAGALITSPAQFGATTGPNTFFLKFQGVANGVSSTTFKIRGGGNAGTTYLNGDGNLAGQAYGGNIGSYMQIQEIQG